MENEAIKKHKLNKCWRWKAQQREEEQQMQALLTEYSRYKRDSQTLKTKEKIKISVKENVKSKTYLAQSIQEVCGNNRKIRM